MKDFKHCPTITQEEFQIAGDTQQSGMGWTVDVISTYLRGIK